MDTQNEFHVENLENFPYSSFNDFKIAIKQKQISLAINTVTIYDLAKLKSTLPYKIWVISAPVPYLAIIIYSIVSATWLLLAGLLAVIMITFLFHPSGSKALKPLLLFLKPATYLSLIYFIITANMPFIVLTLSLVYIHLWWEISLGVSQYMANEILSEDEDILCRVWLSDKMFIRGKNGKVYFRSGTFNS